MYTGLHAPKLLHGGPPYLLDALKLFFKTVFQVEHVSRYSPQKEKKVKPMKSEEYSEYKLVLDAGNNSTRVGFDLFLWNFLIFDFRLNMCQDIRLKRDTN